MFYICLATLLACAVYASVVYYAAYKCERRIRLLLEEEANDFSFVLLDQLSEVMYWKEECCFVDKTLKEVMRRNKLMREALEYVSQRPAYPAVGNSMSEIPGESCSMARDVLKKVTA